MKILFISESPFIPEINTGAARSVMELCTCLGRHDTRPAVLAKWGRYSNTTKVVKDLSLGFPTYRTYDPEAIIPALGTSMRPDIVVLTGGNFIELAGICLDLGIPVVVWLNHVEFGDDADRELDHRIEFVTDSSFVANRSGSMLGVSPHIIPPVFLDHVPLPAGSGETRERTGSCDRILFINPTQANGLEVALAVAGARPDLQFVFRENYPLTTAWRRYCYLEAARSGNIEWLTGTSDLESLYGGIRLLLAPRFSEEGFARSVTEAQLRGIPVLASDRGYLPQNVGPGGCTVDPDTPLDTWLDALDRMLADSDAWKSMCDAAREHAGRPELDPDAVAEQWLTIFHGLVDKSIKSYPGRSQGMQ